MHDHAVEKLGRQGDGGRARGRRAKSAAAERCRRRRRKGRALRRRRAQARGHVAHTLDAQAPVKAVWRTLIEPRGEPRIVADARAAPAAAPPPPPSPPAGPRPLIAVVTPTRRAGRHAGWPGTMAWPSRRQLAPSTSAAPPRGKGAGSDLL